MSKYIGITKEVSENVSFDTILKRLYPILDDVKHNAISVQETSYIWGKNENRGTHKGFELSFADNSDISDVDLYMKLGAMVYFINKEFKGAKAVLTVNSDTFPVYHGSKSIS